MEITYSVGPRYVDGFNIDLDSDSGLVKEQKETLVSDPVTGLAGPGYQPGQKNLDGSDL